MEDRVNEGFLFFPGVAASTWTKFIHPKIEGTCSSDDSEQIYHTSLCKNLIDYHLKTHLVKNWKLILEEVHVTLFWTRYFVLAAITFSSKVNP